MRAFHTKVDLIYEKLKTMINDGEVKPNERLVISQIARENNISDIPVREAIRMLESDGLVKIIPNVGPIVTELRYEDIAEHFMIRGLLEGFATRLSIDLLTNQQLDELDDIIERMKDAYNHHDMKEYSKLNIEFHQLIYSSIKGTKLHNMINELWEKWERTRSVFVLAPERSRESIEEHEQIVAYIKEKKYDEVECLVREHRSRTGRWLTARQEIATAGKWL
jgi:DNA-binding GntR family transcriptional regulator